jgi:hypothetical protein
MGVLILGKYSSPSSFFKCYMLHLLTIRNTPFLVRSINGALPIVEIPFTKVAIVVTYPEESS